MSCGERREVPSRRKGEGTTRDDEARGVNSPEMSTQPLYASAPSAVAVGAPVQYAQPEAYPVQQAQPVYPVQQAQPVYPAQQAQPVYAQQAQPVYQQQQILYTQGQQQIMQQQMQMGQQTTVMVTGGAQIVPEKYCGIISCCIGLFCPFGCFIVFCPVDERTVVRQGGVVAFGGEMER